MPPMRHPGGPPTGNLPQVQGRLAGDCWDSLYSIGQGLEAPFRGPWHFHRHWFGHRGPALGIPLQKKSRTSSTGSDAAASGPCRANSCCPPYPPDRNSPIGSQAPAAQEPAVLSEPTTPSPPKVTTPTPSPPRYVVNIHYLALRDGPSMSAPQIATLNFHDEVELLETSGGWGRVRDVRRNIVGWSYMRYLAAGSD